ncbi:hypothetical protein V8D89_000443 [Ganoderma adspersum]
MPATIDFMFNMQPHYHRVTFDAPYETITVKLILDEAHKAHKSAHVSAGEPECRRERFQFRYITDQAYIIPTLSIVNAPLLLAKRRLYIEESQKALASGAAMPSANDDAAKSSGPSDGRQSYCHPHPDFGPWAPFYERVFAVARMSLQGLIPVKPDVRPLDEHMEVLDGKAFDIRICVYELRYALEKVKRAPDDAHIEALAKLLRELFDDPSLEVMARQSGKGRRVSTDLEVHGECYTAHGLPALYIMGKDTLKRGISGGGNVGGFAAYERAVMGSQYAAVREMTCCPCLIVAMEDYGIQFYAAYFSDRAYRVLLCDIPVLTQDDFNKGPLGEYSNVFKLQVIRTTAQQLRNSYARVHTGSAIPNAPHLFPPHSLGRFTIPEPLLSIDLVDRVPLSSCHYTEMPTVPPPLLFTGFISGTNNLPRPVHVKFIRDQAYGEKAHRLLSSHELKGERMPLAPSFVLYDILPGMQVVVMQTLEGVTLEHLLASVSQEELKDVHTAVALLHRHGFVHGNIRPSNVIIQRHPAGPTRAYLIDFDLAGKAGKVLYLVLDERLGWPRPTWELWMEPITKRHDLFMLENLLKPLKCEVVEDAGSKASDGLNTGSGGSKVLETGQWMDKEPKPENRIEAEAEDAAPDSDDDLDDVKTGQCLWPRPAEELRCQPVTKAHDMFMLEDTLRFLRGEKDANENANHPEE